jgi:hypothetical protein
MPKDYRERIIDERPFRFMGMGPNRATAVSDEEELPDGIFSTIVSLTPGDAVLWVLRLAFDDPSPTGRMVSIVTTAGAEVTHDYFARPAGWTNYITGVQGNVEFDGAGEDLVVDDLAWFIFDQFDDFTPGDYRLSWDIPATARANVEGAILLHGAWDMTGSISPPADYVSVPGTTHASWTYYDPTEPPVMTQSVFSRIGAASGSTLSVSGPTTGGNGAFATSHWLNAIVLHSASGITYETVTFDA